MAKLLIEDSTLTAIGDAIREKIGTNDLINPVNMPYVISTIKTDDQQLKKILDAKKNADYLFYEYPLAQFNDVISHDDTKNVESMKFMFSSSNITSYQDDLFTSFVESFENMFSDCANLTTVKLDTPAVVNGGLENTFTGCSCLESVELTRVYANHALYFTFVDCISLKKIIFREVVQDSSLPVITVPSYYDTLSGCNRFTTNKDGFLYVPDNLVETFKSASGWSDFADQIKGLSELEE